LSQPGWLTYSGRFTHISGHPSAAGRAQDSESSPVEVLYVGSVIEHLYVTDISLVYTVV